TSKYDALGRRVRRFVAATSEDTKFIYDGLDVVMDDDMTTGITKYQNGLGIDDKLKLSGGGVSKYFLADHLGSAVALTNSGGTVTDQTSYDSFGDQTSSLPTRYGFTGRERDNFSGLMYYRARFYDPNLGRFVSEDPIGFDGGDINLFAYVWNSPSGFADPYGESPLDVLEVLNEAKWRAEQRALEALEVPITFTIGYGDTASLGITRGIRDWQGIDTVNWDCLTAYNAGGWAAVAVDAGTGVGGLAKAGFKLAARRGAASALRRTIDDEAKYLVKLNGGKHRVTLRTDKLRLDVDLAGSSHAGIPTPHTKLSLRNLQAPPGRVRYNTTHKQALVERSTIQDLRIVRRYLRRTNR
ncbi:MAG TPA: RHS repeat-associated core domain-containing protein, partial [Pyrinomonadaceae bacterium]|nr:RHS repeat-associated core domain-containing protein [Pyrinomonadaceae bacterium]